MENDNMIFGKRIKLEREKRGISREDFAKMNHITYSALSMYERGERCANDKIKIQIAENLNVSLDYLLGRIDESIEYENVWKYVYTISDIPHLPKNYKSQLSKLVDKLKQNNIIPNEISEITDERIDSIVQILTNNKEFIDILEKKYQEENQNHK